MFPKFAGYIKNPENFGRTRVRAIHTSNIICQQCQKTLICVYTFSLVLNRSMVFDKYF